MKSRYLLFLLIFLLLITGVIYFWPDYKLSSPAESKIETTPATTTRNDTVTPDTGASIVSID